MMKHTWTLLLASLLLVFSLTACGGGDKQTNDQNTGGVTDGAGTSGDSANNGGTTGSANGGTTGDGLTNGGANGTNGASGAANGSDTTNGGSANSGTANGGDTNSGTANGSANNDANTNGNGSLTDDVGNALDDAGRALGGAMNGSAVQQSQGWHGTSFHQMLRNAQVHDQDGDLTDLENSVTPGSTKF